MADTSKIVFFGTPPFAVEVLRALLQSDCKIPLVVTQPDRPAGRGRKLATPAVKDFCAEKNLGLIQPVKMKDPVFHEALRATGARVFVVAAYGRILPKAVLEIPEFTLNVHASLLPKWRGAAPIQRAVMNGDRVTGVSIMRLVEELDAGDVLLKRDTPIEENETAGELENRLAKIGGVALVDALNLIDSGQGTFLKQDPSQATFCPPIDASEGKIDWRRPALEIHNLVRGVNPWPGAYTTDGSTRIKIHQTRIGVGGTADRPPGSLRKVEQRFFVACSDEWLEIVELQREGKSRQNVVTFLSGYRFTEPMLWI